MEVLFALHIVITAVSLFCGAGGLDLGLKQAGINLLWAIDFDKDAVATYRKNIGNHVICDDIKNINFEVVPKCDVVVGGFPCQGFSVANQKRKVDDERNFLYKSFIAAVHSLRPKFFIAENVKGILSLDKGEAIKNIISDFENEGYMVRYKLFNMADYGIPQTRHRVIIIGQRRDIAPEFLFEFPKPTHHKDGIGLPQWKSISEAISHFPDPDISTEYPNHVYSKYRVVFRNFTAHRETDPSKPSPTILARGNGKGGVCAIPHYNGLRRLTIRESAAVQTFPDNFEFIGAMNSCYRQVGNAVPVEFAFKLGSILVDTFNIYAL